MSSDRAAPDAKTLAEAWQVVEGELGERYAVQGYLGQGAFATVWSVRDRLTDETLAVKRLHPELGQPASFYRELRTLFRLRHERVVRVYNLLDAPGAARYLFLEYCPGGSLRTAIQAARRAGAACSPQRVRELAIQILAGLGEAHRLGLVHLDIKPENVLFDARDSAWYGGRAGIKLADFGLSRALEGREDAAGRALRALSGSPAYMAPEQFAGTCSTASDLYSLGVLLFELLHGRLPFTGGPAELARQHSFESPDINPTLPAPWPALLAALLAKDGARRPASAELQARLAEASRTVRSADSRGPKSQPRCIGVPGVGLFALGSSSADAQLVTVTLAGLFRYHGKTGSPAGFTPVPGLTGAVQCEDALWLVRGTEILRTQGTDVPRPVVTLPERPLALTGWGGGDGGLQMAVANADELSWFDERSAPRPQASVPVRTGGFPAHVARLPDGRIACTEGPTSPRLVLHSPDCTPADAIDLPGLVCELGRWGDGSTLYAKVLSGTAFEVIRIDVAARTWVPLPESRGVNLLAVCPWDRRFLYGLQDGSILRWDESGTCATVRRDWDTPGEVRAFAAAGDNFGLLILHEGAWWVRMVDAEASDEQPE